MVMKVFEYYFSGDGGGVIRDEGVVICDFEDYFNGDRGGVVHDEGVGGLCCVKMLANRS